MRLNTPFILASQSPRRRRLLEQIGMRFEVSVSDVSEEIAADVDPAAAAEMLALRKAEHVARRYPEAVTLGADTIVVVDGEILGKPEDAHEAAAMLRRLSGRTHTVFTGIALIHPSSGRAIQAVEATDVTFGTMDSNEIAAYVASGSPMDKAGAYGIQDDRGALFVKRIEGDYYNVVGLPLYRMYRILRESFSDLLACDFLIWNEK